MVKCPACRVRLDRDAIAANKCPACGARLLNDGSVDDDGYGATLPLDNEASGDEPRLQADASDDQTVAFDSMAGSEDDSSAASGTHVVGEDSPDLPRLTILPGT